MSFGIPVRNGLGVGLLASTFLSSLRIGGRPALSLNFIGTNSLDSRVTFTRASTATFVGSNGLIQTAAINAPRFDYNPVTLAPKGLLIEEQRTNLARYSEQFSDASWGKFATATVTANTSIAPDGNTTADTLNTPASGDRINLSPISITGGATYTASLWLSGSGTIFISLASSGGTYTFAGQEITLTATLTRYTVTLTTNANNTAVFPIIGRYNGAVGAGTATSAVIWGYQFEAGAFATSYIPTVASTVTRSADVATMTGTNFSSWYNQTQGTFVANADTAGTTTSSVIMVGADDNNRVQIAHTGSTDALFRIVNAGAAADPANITATKTGFKAALAYKQSDAAASANASAVTTSSPTSMVAHSAAYLGSNAAGGLFLNGHIRQISYYITRLPNAALQVLTA